MRFEYLFGTDLRASSESKDMRALRSLNERQQVSIYCILLVFPESSDLLGL